MRGSRGRPRRSWLQRFVITFNAIAVVCALAAASVLGYLNTKLADVQRLSLGSALTKPDPAPGSPQNFLIVGTDSDLGLSSDDPAVKGRSDVGGSRSDTIMILHVDPSKRAASLLSLQRDLWVEIAGEGIHQKLNSAIGLGGAGTAGPAKLIATIQQNFRIPINHYVEIDFAGFEKLIKTVGGIPIYFNTGLRDRDEYGEPHTIINIPGPGCYTLDPAHALAYARTRHVEIQSVPGDDSSWVSDPSADFGRISRQQDFVKRVLKRAIDKGIRDPLVMNDLVNSGLKSVRVDTALTAGDLLTLGRRFRSMDPDSLRTIQLPAYATTLGSASIVRPRMPEAETVLNEFRNLSGNEDADVSGIEVQVLNGTGRYNEATAVSNLLDRVGFQTEQPGDDLGVTDTASVIRYQPGQESQARMLARYLRSEVVFEVADETNGGDGPAATPLVLITGTSYKGVQASPKPASSVTGPTSTTSAPTTTPATTAPMSSGSSSTTAPTSTTTSVPGYVPGPPPPGTSCG